MIVTLTEKDVQADKHLAMVARQRKLLADLDYKREIARLRARGYTQTDIAQWTGLAQSTIAVTEEVPEIVPGFSGATPLEIAQRYAAGFIDRDQLVDELGRFPYVPQDRLNPADPFDFTLYTDGSWDDIATASYLGLIDDDTYRAVLDAYVAYIEAGKAVAQADKLTV